MDTLKELLNKILSEVADKGYRYSVALKVMMVTVVFVTTYMLILPAITLEIDKAAEQGGIDVPGIEQTVEQTDQQENADSESVSADLPEEESVSDSDVDTSAEDPDAEDEHVLSLWPGAQISLCPVYRLSPSQMAGMHLQESSVW